ncbi:MAG: methyltransferase [Bacteroidetes bacterium]|nr:methyltransferase [Bacteroidota bacterium]
MPNNYFQFKQFIIHQDQCAMKVCTDACLLGAWFAEKIPNYSELLDIGSGTGLLMLMLAQKSKARISGIEIDLQAYKQLKENTGQSKWANRFKVYPGDVRAFSFNEKFDFIISNPPFFENDLVSTVNEKNIAKHSKELSLKELIEAIDANLDSSGSFGILLPYHRSAYFEELAKSYRFHLKEKLLVKQTVTHSYFRSILHFSKNQVGAADEFTLAIQESEGKYSSEFIELMKDYYLKL